MSVLELEKTSERIPFILPSGFTERLAVRESLYGIRPAWALRTPADIALQYSRLEAMTGNTPLLRFDTPNGATIWAKVESENPGSESHYDRATLATFKELHDREVLRPGDKILEVTSGSAGRSFAYFCTRLGFEAVICVPKPGDMPWARRRDMLVLGATLIDADEFGGIKQAIDKFQAIQGQLLDDGYKRSRYRMGGANVFIYEKGGDRVVATNHAESHLTPRAFSPIAREVIAQLPQGVAIDTFVGTLGNGSTIKGIAEVLREAFGDVRLVGTEDLKAPVWFVKKYGEERFEELYGRKPTYEVHDSPGASVEGYNPPFIARMLDQIVEIRLMGNEWRAVAQRYNVPPYLTYDDCATIGHTSAENFLTAQQIAQEGKGRNILVLFYDKADQYADWPPQIGIEGLQYHYNLSPNALPYRPFHDMGDEVKIRQVKQVQLMKWVEAKNAVKSSA